MPGIELNYENKNKHKSTERKCKGNLFLVEGGPEGKNRMVELGSFGKERKLEGKARLSRVK